jgi:hypothetical protein
MRRRGFAPVLVGIGLALAVPAGAQTPPPAAPAPQVIAPGVWAGGIDLSNLTVEQAAFALQTGLGVRLGQTVHVRVAGHRFQLTARQVRQRFDAQRTAKRAYYAGRDHPPPQPPAGTGGTPPRLDVPLAASHRHAVTRDLAAGIARATYRAPHDARVRITVRHIFRRHSHSGHAVDEKALRAALDRAFDEPAAPTELVVARRPVPARVTSNELARVYGTIITVDRDHFRLRLFKRLRFSRAYGIAVGRAGLDTPAGIYHVQDKQVNPAWHVPLSSWAGSLAGQTIPGGAPDNPLKARWMGLANGVGIHGTAEDWSIGTRASHGCIRMHVSDVVALYQRVPLGTTVLIR